MADFVRGRDVQLPCTMVQKHFLAPHTLLVTYQDRTYGSMYRIHHTQGLSAKSSTSFEQTPQGNCVDSSQGSVLGPGFGSIPLIKRYR